MTLKGWCDLCRTEWTDAHECPKRQTNASPITIDQIKYIYGCNQGHDFAVGTTHAVCNRCQKVVRLDVD